MIGPRLATAGPSIPALFLEKVVFFNALIWPLWTNAPPEPPEKSRRREEGHGEGHSDIVPEESLATTSWAGGVYITS